MPLITAWRLYAAGNDPGISQSPSSLPPVPCRLSIITTAAIPDDDQRTRSQSFATCASLQRIFTVMLFMIAHNAILMTLQPKTPLLYHREFTPSAELVRYLSEGALEAMEAQINAQAAAASEPPFEFKTVPQGAATSVWAGVVASADAMGGHYCEDCHVRPGHSQ
ncbi:hypothetical protein [Novacetimonas cocois]|uniref:hypothetical protein n=1 Tax=Novacetimonas cocois TaxID=1747507 RepID=UPI001EF07AD3|nr:hypothetical protein [Novacetimonas cocois]